MKYRLTDSERVDDAVKKILDELGKPNYYEIDLAELNRRYPNIRPKILEAAIQKLIDDKKIEVV